MSNMVDLEVFKKIVGEATFNEVVTKLAGMNIYFPQNIDAKYPNKTQRNEQIRFDYYTGMKVPELISKYSLTKSRIYKIVEFK